MLDKAFLETADYRTLIESSDRTVIVGRRGTGKSALTMKLETTWKTNPRVSILKITPEEHQTIALRPKIALFGDKFNMIRAGSRLVWKYALMMEIAINLSTNYVVRNSSEIKFLQDRLDSWRAKSDDILNRLSIALNEQIDHNAPPESRIEYLPKSLDLRKIEEKLRSIGETSGQQVVLLVDKLDEGYEPDASGTALIDGLIHAAQDLKVRFDWFKPVIFLRDNIFRAIEVHDNDFSRNIEGNVLRLHWSETSLWTFSANRIKAAFGSSFESNEKIWNAYTSQDLAGIEGLKKCLSKTLYRPRDILSLLNQAFFLAGKDGVQKISSNHIRQTSRQISRNRLIDLNKEYKGIFPSLSEFTAAFRDSNPEFSLEEVTSLLSQVIDSRSEDPIIQQDFDILGGPEAALDMLYSVGFIGISGPEEDRFVFCHDGRTRDREFLSTNKVLIHPCYWIALNCTEKSIDPEQAEDIYDEYDIAVSSETPEIRRKKIEELVSELENIEEGKGGAQQFELWCVRAITICFAKGLENIELKPNQSATLRRDIVATNLGDGTAWQRILEDYQSRQVIFEVKNKRSLSSQDYQQVVTYLSGYYGKLAFFITRDTTENLLKGRDLDWFKELHASHGVFVIKLTANFFRKQLHKLRNPQKHDTVNNAINRLLDTYTRLYLSGQTKS